VLCSKCAANLPEGSEFCLKCGEPVESPANEPIPQIEDALLACSKCGTTLPDGAEFCLKCGKPVSSGKRKIGFSQSPGVIDAPQLDARPKRKRRFILPLLLLGLLLAATVWVATSDNPFAQGLQELVGWKHDQPILGNPFSVSAHSFRYYKFSLPEGSLNVAIVGQFSASGGSRNAPRNDKTKDAGADDNIEVLVLSEPAFAVWQNGYAASAVYESGKVSQGAVQADLPAGAGVYYLVFSNKFSAKTAKNVTASVALRYKSWLPDWFRRVKGLVWNWLGL
jgi:ribosomal protein L40E